MFSLTHSNEFAICVHFISIYSLLLRERPVKVNFELFANFSLMKIEKKKNIRETL